MRVRQVRLLAASAAFVALFCVLGGGARAVGSWNYTDPTVFAPTCLSPLHRDVRHCLDPSTVWGVSISGNTHTIDPAANLKYQFAVDTPPMCPAKLTRHIVCTVMINWGVMYGASLADWGLGPTEALDVRPYDGCNGNDRKCNFTVAPDPSWPGKPLVKGTALRVTAVAEVIGLSCGHGPGYCYHWVDWRLRLGSQAESLGIDWTMPSRLYPDNSDWGGTDGLPPASFVNPTSWQVDLFLTSDDIKTCPEGSTFDWTISSGGKTDTLPSHGCTASAEVPKLGVYTVSAKEVTGTAPGTVVKNPQVVVRNWLFVGLGDSNGSGQGNPPYLNDRCDRSDLSYQYQTALYVEQHDPRSSVTFVFDACSGARSDQIWQNGYEGQEPNGTPDLPPQLEQVESVIGDRKPDAVIVSAGINDLYFGSIMGFCTLYSPGGNTHGQTPGPASCQDAHVTATQDGQGYTTGYAYSTDAGDQTVATRTASRLSVLPNRLSLLAQHLDELGAAHIFATQYPDETTDAAGHTCDGTGPFPKLSSGVWGWLHQVGGDLNSAVAGTSSFGWTPITGVADGFIGHGYCSTDSYFDTPARSVWEQANAYGSFHATAKGAAITYMLTRDKVCEALYGNAGCDGLPPAPK